MLQRKGGECNGGTTGGMWCQAEISLHINCLELKVARFALTFFCKEMSNVHIKLLTDNSTTVACINHMGLLVMTLQATFGSGVCQPTTL